MRITVDLDKLVNFLNKGVPGAISKALEAAQEPLRNALETKVFTNHGDTKTIETIDELRNLIRMGSNHEPADARDGPAYNKEYLDRKQKGSIYSGVYKPHVFEQFGFWRNIKVNSGRDTLTAKVIERYLKRGFDYLSHHEQRRSVLKRAFHEAWADMVDRMIKSIAESVKK